MELGLQRGDEGKMRSLGWVLTPQDWGPYKKRRSGHRHTQRDDPVRTQGGDGRLHAEERGLRRTQPCPHLGLGFQPPGPGGNTSCCLSCPGCGLCYGPRRPTQGASGRPGPWAQHHQHLHLVERQPWNLGPAQQGLPGPFQPLPLEPSVTLATRRPQEQLAEQTCFVWSGQGLKSPCDNPKHQRHPPTFSTLSLTPQLFPCSLGGGKEAGQREGQSPAWEADTRPARALGMPTAERSISGSPLTHREMTPGLPQGLPRAGVWGHFSAGQWQPPYCPSALLQGAAASGALARTWLAPGLLP